MIGVFLFERQTNNDERFSVCESVGYVTVAIAVAEKTSSGTQNVNVFVFIVLPARNCVLIH